MADQNRTTLDRNEFVERFVAAMLRIVGPKDAVGDDVESYARETAPSYWEEQHRNDTKRRLDLIRLIRADWPKARVMTGELLARAGTPIAGTKRVRPMAWATAVKHLGRRPRHKPTSRDELRAAIESMGEASA